MRLLEYIFSVKNDYKHKVVCIMGFKFKIYSNKLANRILFYELQKKISSNNIKIEDKIKQNQIDIKNLHNEIKQNQIDIKNLHNEIKQNQTELESLNNSFFIYNNQYKYVHLMNNGIHSIDVIRFINKYLNNNNEHCFVFPVVLFDKTKNALIQEKNVYFCKLKNLKYLNNNKFIVHGLFDTTLVKELYNTPQILQKTYWYIWGGDLYDYIENDVANYVRKNVAGIITPFDKEIYETKLNCTKPYFDIPYDNALLKYSHDSTSKNNDLHILINNCTDSTTLEMLNILSKFKNENIRVSTVLSYTAAGQEDCKKQIIKLGTSIFKDKFNPILDFLPLKDYAEFLNSVDIYISNQNRQQGQGNASFLLSQGKKVYVKGNTSVYKRYAELGILYADTNKIKDMNFEEFININKDEQANSVKNLKERQSLNFILSKWQNFLSYEGTNE